MKSLRFCSHVKVEHYIPISYVSYYYVCEQLVISGSSLRVIKNCSYIKLYSAVKHTVQFTRALTKYNDLDDLLSYILGICT